MNIRRLQNSDGQALERFLSAYVETSMFFLSNMRRGGLEYQGKDYEGNYLGTFDDGGNVTGVLAHYWNGNLMMQAENQSILKELLNTFLNSSPRPLAGVFGPEAQASFVLKELSVKSQDYAKNSTETLYSLDLEELRMPHGFDFSHVEMVQASSDYIDVLRKWMKGYEIEAFGAEESKEFNERVELRVQNLCHQKSSHWMLLADGKPVCMSGFNARLPGVVQVGLVWTPLENRGCGYVRALMAMILEKAKEENVRKAILFTANPAAAKAYEAIGFKETGSCRLAIFRKPIDLKEGL